MVDGVSNISYKRGQVEWALWRALEHACSPSNDPSPLFRTRIKRLLDIDRDPDFKLSYVTIPPSSVHAFATPTEIGKGGETAYAPFDVFCLALGIELLDVGFKQGEIVYLMRFLRKTLEPWFVHCIALPSLRTNPAHAAGPDVADPRVFLLLGRIEPTVPMPATKARKSQGAFLRAPEIWEGVDEVRARLDEVMPYARRSVITLEITALAQAVETLLAEAPAMPRGRPRRNS